MLRQGKQNEGMFCGVDQIFFSQEHVDLARLICFQPSLACVCDVKEAGGDMYYRLNDERLLAWLRCKVSQTQAALISTSPAIYAGMDEPALAAYSIGVSWPGSYGRGLNVLNRK